MPYCTIQNKQFYYQEKGAGTPLIFLHGNTASSNMFYEILPLYKGYRLILPDFLGNGKSQRLDCFPVDFWYDQACQLIELLDQLKLRECILVGTSGGAIAALNVALERPDLCRCVICDSFMGEKMEERLFHGFEEERIASLENEESSLFYKNMQGEDYEKVVLQDTAMLVEHVKANIRCVHKYVEDLKVPVLLLGSSEDDMITKIDSYYTAMCKRSSMLEMKVFDKGTHPSLCTNAKQCAYAIHEFIYRHI